jgi:hypothetical protein
MRRVPNPAKMKPLRELTCGVTVYDPEGRKGFTTVPRKGDPGRGIYIYELSGMEKTVYYDENVEVEVIDYNFPKPL